MARQSCGALGKTANCQGLVSLTLARGEVPVPVALRLYLPEAWTADPARCRRAGVPARLGFRPKWQIAPDELDRVRAAGARFGLVLADAGYAACAADRRGPSTRGLSWGRWGPPAPRWTSLVIPILFGASDQDGRMGRENGLPERHAFVPRARRGADEAARPSPAPSRRRSPVHAASLEAPRLHARVTVCTAECEIDLRPGGIFRTVMRSPEGRELSNVGCYLEAVEHERLAWTTALAPGYRPSRGPSEVPFFTAVITLEARGKGTKSSALALRGNESDRKTHEAMGLYEGWGEALDQLAAAAKTT